MAIVPEEFQMYFDVFFLVAALGINIIAATIILMKTPMKKPENAFLLNRLICNLISSCLVCPQLLARETSNCVIVEFTVSFSTVSNTITTLLISLDQFVTIRYPHQKLNTKKSLIAIIFQWILSIATGLLSAFTMTPAPGVWKICKIPNEQPEEMDLDIYRQLFAALLMTVTVICFSATVIMRCQVAEIAFRSYRSRMLGRLSDNLNVDPAESNEENGDENDKSKIAFQCALINDILEKSQKYYKQTKALRDALIIILFSFATQFPLALLQLSSSLEVTPYRGLLMGSAVSPFLFLYQNKNIILEFRKIAVWLKSFLSVSHQRQSKPAESPVVAENVPVRHRIISVPDDVEMAIY